MVFADVQVEEEQPTKRRRAEPRRLWRFRIPSPAEFDLEDSEASTAAEMEIERPLGHDRTNKRFSTAGPFGVGIARISPELVKNERSAPGCSVESEVICGEGADQGDPFGEGCCAIQQVKSKVDLNSTKPSLNVADLEGFSQLDGAAGDCRRKETRVRKAETENPSGAFFAVVGGISGGLIRFWEIKPNLLPRTPNPKPNRFLNKNRSRGISLLLENSESFAFKLTSPPASPLRCIAWVSGSTSADGRKSSHRLLWFPRQHQGKVSLAETHSSFYGLRVLLTPALTSNCVTLPSDATRKLPLPGSPVGPATTKSSLPPTVLTADALLAKSSSRGRRSSGQQPLPSVGPA
ncbi:unnamed protein product [Linum trigynum]|uniref:Uncharacterized protein n=1 Tax=Linum trigynum TaxID=586398 RepID=A0AAV2CJ83_9ROSI